MAGRPKSGRRRRRPSVWGARIRAFFGGLFALILIAGIGGTLYAGKVLREIVDSLPSSENLNRETAGGVTEIYATDRDASGKNILLGQIYRRHQEFVPLAEIPQSLVNATVAIEDERFFQHPGVDLKGILRAVYRNVQGGKMSQGASTLTQQLVRNVILESQKKTVDRKLQEAIIAVKVERDFTKEQILEKYLNEVCYGSNIYGVKAAAKLYFGKKLSQLTIGEAATLAGIPNRPTYLELFRHKDNAIERRNLILEKMVELGYVTRAQATTEKSRKIVVLKEPARVQAGFKAPYFVNYVLKRLYERHGAEMVERGGLKVYTTLNWEMQQKAEETLRAGVREGRGDGVREGALVCLEPKTGYIRAMAGGTNWEKDQYNFAVQGGRQPGSTFKPIIYAAAFSTGKFSPDSELEDRPKRYGRKTFKNYGGGYSYASIPIRRAIAKSTNTIPVEVLNRIGFEPVFATSRALGMELAPAKRPNINRNLSLALGTANATPLQMASAYTAFENHGDRPEPMAVIRVLDSEGRVLENNGPLIHKGAIPPRVADDISDCLRGVVEFGTAAGAAGIHEIAGARGKTGTTSNNLDAWFVGYSPELTTAVWVCGLERVKKGNRVIPKYREMDGVTGGHVCAPIWAAFMKLAVPIQQKATIQIPTGKGIAIGAAPVPVPSPSPMASPTNLPTPAPANPNASPTPSTTARRETRAAPITSSTVPSPEPNPSENAPPQIDPTRLTETAPTPTPRPVAMATEPLRTAPARPERSPDRPVAPRPRTAAPVTPRNPDDDDPLVAVTICVDSGRLGTIHCPETRTQRMRKSAAPKKRCTIHAPRPDEL